jgi:glycosyltransferase involved in cell wall biosynthesis
VQRELERRQRALQASDAIIAVSRFVAETLQNRVPESRLAIVPNLIDLDATQAAARPSSAGNPSPSAKRDYLLFIGKLNELKGADLLPEILRRSGLDLPLVVAGEGELRSRLVGTPGIQVRGWLANAETLALLGGARALLFPSRWAEPLARTLLEAQALGVPTVAWNSGGTRDIIEDNLNGLLAAHLDEFAGQLRRLVQDEALAQTLSANARRVAQTKFAPPVVAAHLEATYQAVVRPPG